MPTSYASLKRTLETLEGKIPSTHATGFPGSGAVRVCHGDPTLSVVQGYGLDQSIGPLGLELPVVIAVGANYTQGKHKTPRGCAAPSNAVEEPYDLRADRRHLVAGFASYNAEREVWYNSCAASSPNLALPNEFHFVMTNFCIWLTDDKWQNIQPHVRASLLENNPPLGTYSTIPGHWGHLEQLAQALRRHEVFWVGHGKDCEVFALFRQFVRSIQSDRWLLMPNLSYPYHRYSAGRFLSRAIVHL